jgi:hypothetical protein
MAHPPHITPGASPRRKFDPAEQEQLTLAQALLWIAYPNDPGRVRDAAPERVGLHRRAQPWEEWTPELGAALTRLLPLLKARKIFAVQGGEQVLWTDPNLIRIEQRIGNWFEGWLAVFLTMDPQIMLDVADIVEAFPELLSSPRPTSSLHSEGSGEVSLATLIRDAYEMEKVKNADDAYNIVRERVKMMGFHVSRDQFDDVRQSVGIRGRSGPRPRK